VSIELALKCTLQVLQVLIPLSLEELVDSGADNSLGLQLLDALKTFVESLI